MTARCQFFTLRSSARPGAIARRGTTTSRSYEACMSVSQSVLLPLSSTIVLKYLRVRLSFAKTFGNIEWKTLSLIIETCRLFCV